MVIQKLEVRRFRNLSHVMIDPHSKLNIIYGGNGSGKTSLLEAIYYLSRGRSFRTFKLNHIIQDQQPSFSIMTDVSCLPMMVERRVNGSYRLQIGGNQVSSIADLTKMLPIQLINVDTYSLIQGSPRFRRQYIDWGVFHLEHSFFSIWKDMKRILKQRNLAIKQHDRIFEVTLWDKIFIDTAMAISRLRYHYINQLKSFLSFFFEKISHFGSFFLDYYHGWPKKENLISVFKSSLTHDLNCGYTRYGPHRADLLMTVDKIAIKDRLSRGQQKLFIYAMLFAQGNLFFSQKEKSCIYLIDDLSVELDQKKESLLFLFLKKLNAQVFMTTTSKKSLTFLMNHYPTKMFHMEQGRVIN